ncbi:hypothetical protein [Pseudozobellia thermophila]|uniref:Lipoprotein n=1 Tax=Pseudozobellia thermophila TaxID=192903 RepID=A0A1M6C2I7_9FLAO|nr:hypothetical protein [Pseudozobellia thermophila]SHI55173.1 hypothetical protein SAMN04488513_101616 [Pseudozobellia thermophila]
MKDIKKLVAGLLVLSSMSACMGETKEKLKKAKEGVSNSATLVNQARKFEDDVEKLKNAEPLTATQLKEWLPEKIDGLNRTGFKTGQAGMYNVKSIEGTFKDDGGKKKLRVNVVDGAGPTGSIMAASYSVANNMEMEEEDENKHKKNIEVDGIKARQTYWKKTNKTMLSFTYNGRFLVTVNATGLDPEETWELVDRLNLDDLADMAD